MQTIIGIVFCLVLGVMVKAQGWFALLWLPLGFVIGLFATAQIALPIMLGLPRAVRLVSRGEMRSAVYARLLLTPVLWIVGLLVISFLVGFFWPGGAEWVTENSALNLGTWLGIIAILLSPLSKKSRYDFRLDFDRSYALREDEVARFAVACFDQHFAVHGSPLAVACNWVGDRIGASVNVVGLAPATGPFTFRRGA